MDPLLGHAARFALGPYIPLEEYVRQPDVLVIRAEDIKPEERLGELHDEGYIWH